MPRKRRGHYPPKETPVMTAIKGWQVTTPIPGSDDFVEQWFDYRFKRLFVKWLDWDLAHPESGSTVRWVGF
jgi:hypothetical protein